MPSELVEAPVASIPVIDKATSLPDLVERAGAGRPHPWLPVKPDPPEPPGRPGRKR